MNDSFVPLLDGDILVYRIGFAAENDAEGIAAARAKEFIVDLLMDYAEDDYFGFLTSNDKSNFRFDIAKTAPYKGNRKAPKPKHYDFLRNYLVEEWGFEMISGEEADDAIGIRATELGDKALICSIDKDLNNIPGWHLNFVKKELYYVTEAEGMRNFYRQLLTGDKTDNIIGLRGIGPVKAEKLLKDCKTEFDYYAAVLNAYEGDEDRVLENGRLLWIRRKPGEMWVPNLETV